MALSRVKTWSAGEVLTASDLNSEFNSILNNPITLWSPAGAAVDFDGQILTLDAAAATTLNSSAAVSFNIVSGAKTGTPATTGSIANWSAQTFTDNATAGSGTAAAYVAHGFQRPTLAATNASVTTTDAATVYIPNNVAAGTNETLTNSWALWIDAGNVRFDGQICGLGAPITQELRLTLTTATPVTNADVTAATTLYLTPYKGTHIALYDGTIWHTYSTAEISIAVPATTVTMYDIFCYSNAGTPTLELTAWTNDTTRATALAYQNGVLVKSGTTTRRYIGSFRTTGVSGQTEDSISNRFIWNYYNRVLRHMRAIDATDTWTYTTAAFRQANGAATNQLNFIVGVSEDTVTATVCSSAYNSGGAGVTFATGIGLDSSTVNAAFIGSATATISTSVPMPSQAQYRGFPAVGKHDLRWLEYSAAIGTTTWVGDNGQTAFNNGIVGEFWN